MMDALHRSYESIFLYNAPRGRSKKTRRYEHVDITREFEILTARRNVLKAERLEELYDKHEQKVSLIKDVALPVEEPMISDGEEADSARRNAVRV